MGDVFDALNRAKRERGEQIPPPQSDPKGKSAAGGGATPPGESPGEFPGEFSEGEKPALPIDQINATPIFFENQENQDDLRLKRPITPSFESAKVETVGRVAEEPDSAAAKLPQESQKAEPTKKVDPNLNGYAAEVIVHYDKGGAITEQYRAIRTQILSRARIKPLQTHVITSSAPGEGKSVTTINLGIMFAELTNHKTLLIEGDLRRPSFRKLLQRDPTPGMLQLLRGEVTDIDQAIHPTVYDNLQFISAGGHDHLHSTELLSSPRMAQILDRLKDRYEHIFIDSPPVVSVTDAAILGALCDQVLLVVRLYKTPVEVVDRAKRLLRANNCDLAGVIVTHMKVHIPRYLYKYGYYYYGYSYGSSYGPTPSEQKDKDKDKKESKSS